MLPAPISFANTGGWQNWTSVNAGNIALTAGTHVIKFYTKGGMNFDKMIFSSSGNQLPYYGTPLPIPGTVQAEDYDRACWRFFFIIPPPFKKFKKVIPNPYINKTSHWRRGRSVS